MTTTFLSNASNCYAFTVRTFLSLFLFFFISYSVIGQCEMVNMYDLRGVPGFAQTDDLNVCGAPDTLAVLVFTDSEDELKGVKLTVHLPSSMQYAGFELSHFASTTTQLLDGSDPRNPIFLLSDLDQNSTNAVYIGVSADCNFSFDAEEQYVTYDIEYITPTGVCTDTYEDPTIFDNSFRTPVLNVISVTPATLNFTNIGQSLTRTIKVSQDGVQSYLDSFNLTINDLDLGSGIDITGFQVNGTNAAYTYDAATMTLNSLIDGQYFSGNYDPLGKPADDKFDVNEQVTIWLTYQFTSCPSSNSFIHNHTASYGCYEETCNYDEQGLNGGLTVNPDFGANPEVTFTTTQQPGMCGEEAIIEWEITSENPDPLAGLFQDLAFALKVCDPSKLDITEVSIGGTVLSPGTEWTLNGTLLSLELDALSTDPDVGGLSDYDGDGKFNDLEGGQIITGQFKASLVCGAEDCSSLACTIDQVIIQSGKRNCGNEFSANPTFATPLNFSYGSTASSNNMDDSDGDNIQEINVVTPSPWNGGTPATEFTIQHGYAYESTGITMCPNPKTYLEVVISGADTVIQDIEFTLGSVTWDGVAIPDDSITMTYPSTGLKVLRINYGDEDNANLKLYEYNLEVNDCLAPTRYVTMTSRVVQSCEDPGCDCTITKGCENYVVQIDYPGCGLPCDIQTVQSFRRKNLGYTDPSLTTQVQPSDLNDADDLFRIMNHDTIITDIIAYPNRAGVTLDSLMTRWFLTAFPDPSIPTTSGYAGTNYLQYQMDLLESTIQVSFYDADGGPGGTGIYINPTCDIEVTLDGYEGANSPTYNGRWYADAHNHHIYLFKHDDCMDEYPDVWNPGDSLFLSFEGVIEDNERLDLGCGNGQDQGYVSVDHFGVRTGDVLDILPDWGSAGINCTRPLAPIYFDCPDVTLSTNVILEDCTDTYEHTFSVSGIDASWYQDEIIPWYQITNVEAPFVGATYLIQGSEEIISYNSATGIYDLVTPTSFTAFDSTNCVNVSGVDYCYPDPLGTGDIIFDASNMPLIGHGQGHNDHFTLKYQVGKLCPYEADLLDYEIPFEATDLACDTTVYRSNSFATGTVTINNLTTTPSPLNPALTTQVLAPAGATQHNIYTVCNDGAAPGGSDHNNLGTNITIPNNVGLVSVTDVPTSGSLTFTAVESTPDYTIYFVEGPLALAPQTCLEYDIETELLFCPTGDNDAQIDIETFSGCLTNDVRSQIIIDNDFDGANNCENATISYVYDFKASDLQLELVEEPNMPVELCEEVYYAVRTKNVKTGTNVDQLFSFYFPSEGINPVSGSWQVSYPHGPTVQSPWQNIGTDPTLNVPGSNAYGDRYDYTVAELHAWLANNGLMGVSANTAVSDSNKVAIRFAVRTECDTFTSGVPFYFDVTGADACGNATDAALAVTNNLVIENADPVDFAQYLVFAEPAEMNCNAATTFEVTGLNLADSTSNEYGRMCLMIPADFTYTSGSATYTVPLGFAANTSEETLPNGDVKVCMDVPEGITTGNFFKVAVDLIVPTTEACGTTQLGVDIKSFVPGITCTTDNNACGVYVQNSINPVLDIEIAPYLSTQRIEMFSNCSANAGMMEINYEIDLENNGPAISGDNVTVNVYKDLDGNQLLDTGIDQLLFTDVNTATIATGSTITITGTGETTDLNNCDLIANLVFDNTCACNEYTEYIGGIQSEILRDYVDEEIGICPGETFTVEACNHFNVDPLVQYKGATEVVYELEVEWGGFNYSLPSPGGVYGVTFETMNDSTTATTEGNLLLAEQNAVAPDAWVHANFPCPVNVSQIIIAAGLVNGWGHATGLMSYATRPYVLEYSYDKNAWYDSGLVFTGADNNDDMFVEILPDTIVAQYWRMSSIDEFNWGVGEFRFEGPTVYYTPQPTEISGGQLNVNIPTDVGPGESWEVEVTVGNGACANVETLSFINMDGQGVDAGADQMICPNECTDIEVTLDNGATSGATYAWTPVTFLDDPTSQNPEVCNITATTEYIVSVILPTGCILKDTVFVELNPLLPPTPMVTGDDEICDSGTDIAIIEGPAGFDQYTWYFDNPTGPDYPVYSSSTSNEFPAMNPGSYYLEAQMTGGCPGASAPFTITEILCGTIGDEITYADTDGPIPNVMVVLYDGNGNPLDTAYTDANGNYLFDNLEAGDYTITVDPSNFTSGGPLDGLDLVTDPDGGFDNTSDVTLAAGEDNLDQDFAYNEPLGSIGNLVWLDENGDGYQDAGEPGIANVDVVLYNSLGEPIDTVKTDANGGYLFTDLPAGDYSVAVDPNSPSTLPDGLTQTNLNKPGGDFGNQTPGYNITLGPGEENLTADFGYNYGDSDGNTGNGALGDQIWMDVNGDGNEDPGEPGIGGVTVTIYYDSNGDGIVDPATDTPYTGAIDQNGNTGTGTTTTEPDGSYIFHDLPPGQYVVVVDDTTLPAGTTYTQTGDPDELGNTATNPDNQSEPILIAPGDVYVNADFGYQPDAPLNTIGDQIWFDTNADGVADPGEQGIEGVTVSLLDANGNVIASTQTDANGNYLFEGVPDGTYSVWVNDANNVLDGLDQTGDPDANNDNMSTVTVSGGQTDLDQDFGYTPAGHDSGDGLIGDTVFLDQDRDGQPDPGEGIEGVEVNLLDGNGNIIATTITDENGNYFFGGLDAGDYVVQINTSTLPPDVNNTVDPDPSNGMPNESEVTLATGEINLDQDFGYEPASNPGSIGTLIWEDTNADGNVDPGEQGIEGVTVDLYWDVDGDGIIEPGEPLIGSTVTDASGNYLFENLPTDGGVDYVVDVTDDAGILSGYWHSDGIDNTNDNSQTDSYPVSIGGSDPVDDFTADFGYYIDPASVGNFVWEDTNMDGIQDASELGVEGVEVTLTITYPDGTIVTLVDSTDATGHYSFDNLLLDEDYNGDGSGAEPTYEITMEIPAGYAGTTVDVNGNGNDSEDADDPNGTAANPVQGQTDVTQNNDPNAETAPATVDFGIISYALPVDLTSFEGFPDDCKVQLRWRTELEENFDHYELEHSVDGNNYEVITRVMAAGGSDPQVYQYLHEDVFGNNYYRLKMIDNDGSFKYSNVIVVNTGCGETAVNEMVLYPNPIGAGQTVLSVKFYTEELSSKVMVFDASGKLVKALTVDTDSGWNTIRWDVSDLPSGTFFISKENNGKRETKPFVVQE